MRYVQATLLGAGLLVGCFDHHGPREDGGPIGDASPTVDGGPACEVEGFPVRGEGDFAGCECPDDLYVVGPTLRPPAPLAAQRGTIRFCWDHTHRSVAWPGLCENGGVTHRYPGEARDVGVSLSGCLPSRLCVFLETQLPEELRGACFYADNTVAETGVLRQVGDCGSLPEGLCSVDCPCPDEARPVCYGLSESRPVGACTLSGSCGQETWESITGPCLDTCLRATDPPRWVIDELLDGGRCTTSANCEALAERYPGVWRCERG